MLSQQATAGSKNAFAGFVSAFAASGNGIHNLVFTPPERFGSGKAVLLTASGKVKRIDTVFWVFGAARSTITDPVPDQVVDAPFNLVGEIKANRKFKRIVRVAGGKKRLIEVDTSGLDTITDLEWSLRESEHVKLVAHGFPPTHLLPFSGMFTATGSFVCTDVGLFNRVLFAGTGRARVSTRTIGVKKSKKRQPSTWAFAAATSEFACNRAATGGGDPPGGGVDPDDSPPTIASVGAGYRHEMFAPSVTCVHVNGAPAGGEVTVVVTFTPAPGGSTATFDTDGDSVPDASQITKKVTIPASGPAIVTFGFWEIGDYSFSATASAGGQTSAASVAQLKVEGGVAGSTGGTVLCP